MIARDLILFSFIRGDKSFCRPVNLTIIKRGFLLSHF